MSYRTEHEDVEIENLRNQFELNCVLISPTNFGQYYNISQVGLEDEPIRMQELAEDVKQYLKLSHERDLQLRKARRLLHELNDVKERLRLNWKQDLRFEIKDQYESKLFGKSFTLRKVPKLRNLTMNEFKKILAVRLARRIIEKDFVLPTKIKGLSSYITRFYKTIPNKVDKGEDIVRVKYPSRKIKRKSRLKPRNTKRQKTQRQPINNQYENDGQHVQISQIETISDSVPLMSATSVDIPPTETLSESAPLLSSNDMEVECPSFLNEEDFIS